MPRPAIVQLPAYSQRRRGCLGLMCSWQMLAPSWLRLSMTTSREASPPPHRLRRTTVRPRLRQRGRPNSANSCACSLSIHLALTRQGPDPSHSPEAITRLNAPTRRKRPLGSSRSSKRREWITGLGHVRADFEPSLGPPPRKKLSSGMGPSTSRYLALEASARKSSASRPTTVTVSAGRSARASAKSTRAALSVGGTSSRRT